MQRSTHAGTGAWTLGPTSLGRGGDAYHSIQLVGSTTVAPARAVDAPAVPGDPIAAARTWLADPAMGGSLTPELRERAEETLVIAALHLHELDMSAGEVANQLLTTGDVDRLLVERIDGMSTVLETFSNRLRDLLEPTTVDPEAVERRLGRALAAAAHGGGLPAFVAALA